MTKPAAIKLLEGNLGNRPINVGPDFQALNSEPPDFLSDLAKQEWHRVYPLVASNNVCSEADQWVLATYCQSYAEYIEQSALIEKEKKKLNSPIKSPRLAIRQQAFNNLMETGKQLGFTPVARQKIAANAQQGDDSLSDIDPRGLF